MGLSNLICFPSSNGREVWEVWRSVGHTSPKPLGVASLEMAGQLPFK